MAKRTKKVRPEFRYAEHFDKAMGIVFGEEFKTEWNIFVGSWGNYSTRRVNGKKLTRRMAQVGAQLSTLIGEIQDNAVEAAGL